MFELIDYLPEHAERIHAEGSKERAADRAKMPDDEWAAKLGQGIVAKTGMLDGQPVGCGGLFQMWPGVAEAWVVLHHNIEKMMPRAGVIVRRQLYDWMEEFNLVRVQAPLRADWPVGLRFAKWLGMMPDGAEQGVADGVIMRNYHFDGTDAIMHSIITERD